MKRIHKTQSSESLRSGRCSALVCFFSISSEMSLPQGKSRVVRTAAVLESAGRHFNHIARARKRGSRVKTTCDLPMFAPGNLSDCMPSRRLTSLIHVLFTVVCDLVHPREFKGFAA